jgi:NADH-quinone oxidoreductase subunit F
MMPEKPLTKNIRPGMEPLDIKAYETAGGYQSVRKALKSMSPSEVLAAVKSSNLLGRGGAGFPTGVKWSFVPMGPEVPRPKYLVANADEMEPGTFKDRIFLEGEPHLLLEGMILSAYAIEAGIAYIFLRAEYKLSEMRLLKAIGEAYAAGFLGKNILNSEYSLEMILHTSAGRYMCGEETALLNALEGRRATPRAKPPFPQKCGLWGKPTIVQNVETLCNIPGIILHGADWYNGLSLTPGEGGTKIYGVSGRVKRPGWWELPLGTTLREIIENHAGGMMDGYKLRGVLPGGASTDFLTADHLDLKMDFKAVQSAGSRMGTGTMHVLDDKTCPIGMVHNMIRFFAQESCGWCTPCRDGLPWIEKILHAFETGEAREEDLGTLELHTKFLGPGMTFCPLAPGAMEPLQSALKYFREDFEEHLRSSSCPYNIGH